MTDAYAAGWQDAPLAEEEGKRPPPKWETSPLAETAPEKPPPRWWDVVRGTHEVLTGKDRYQLWPERMAREAVSSTVSGLSLPGEVLAGKLDPMSDEAIKRAYDIAFLGSPVNPGFRAGARPGFNWQGYPGGNKPFTEGERAAMTASELGAPLPRGVTSDSTILQSLTSAARSLPIVGQKITDRVTASQEAAGAKVGEIASTLGTQERAGLGLTMRDAIDNVVAGNKADISAAYRQVLPLIPSSTLHVPRHTRVALDKIVAERTAARQEDPTAGLGQIRNMIDQGITFEGLIRAKSDLGQAINFAAPHAGFSVGDQKLLGAAMSRDLYEFAGTAVRPDLRQRAIQNLAEAENTASNLITLNNRLRQLTGSTDESLASALLTAGREKSGDVQLLAQLKASLPRDQFSQIAGSTITDLGRAPTTGEFSLGLFSSNWNRMSNAGKAVLFTAPQRKALDSIADMGTHIKTAERFLNWSGTARAGGVMALTAGVTGATVAALGGNFYPALVLGGTALGSYATAAAMARPQVAAAMSGMAQAARTFERAPNAVTRGLLLKAEQSALKLVADHHNMSPSELLQVTFPNRPEGGFDVPPPAGQQGPPAPRQLPMPAQDIPVPRVPYNPNVL